jgi:hypothetical protein
MSTGQLFYDPIARPLSSTGTALALGYYNFYVSGTTTAATIYQDPALTIPYPAASLNGSAALYSVVQGNSSGAFNAIYLNPQTIYRVQLYNSLFQLIEDVDPFIPAFMTTGNGQVAVDAQGEVTINAPTPGGAGTTLTLASRSGGFSLQLTAGAAGAVTIAANNTVTVGTQTATFTATNKPGSGTTAPTKWLPIQCDGATYYIPLWT